MRSEMQMQLQGSPSPPYNYHSYYPLDSPPPNPPCVQFPTSPQHQHQPQHQPQPQPQPQPADEEIITIQHYSHPNHPLAQITVPADLFLCGGCKEYGAGKRFTCQECDFQLHEFCALYSPTLRGHPLHPQHQLVFHSRPKQAGISYSWPKCDICGKSIKGFTYRCRACGFQMHPCCAMLSTQIMYPLPAAAADFGVAVGNDHHHSLKLLPPGPQLINNANNGNNNIVVGDNHHTVGTGQVQVSLCGECKKKRSSGRMYRCTSCNYHLHAVCAKDMINGLQANGMTAPEKPNKSKSMLGTAARLASQVVIEFIGGLIEGFGEGVGQALVQNRGRRLRSRTPTTT